MLHQGPWKGAEYLGQIGGKFCLFQTQDGMMIMNPSAASERILFERAKTDLEKENIASQKLLVPETVVCDPKEAQKIEQYRKDLISLGFGIAPFGGHTYLVEAIPSWMGDVDPSTTLKELAMEPDPQKSSFKSPKQMRDKIARSCCRLAAQKRKKYTPEECERLVKDLANCQMPYTTPYGRPTLIHTSQKELNRKFGLDG